MDKNSSEIFKLNGVYAFQLTTGSVVSGILVGKSENLVKNEIEIYYRLALSESKYVDFREDEIVNIYSDEYSERMKYLHELEEKYNIQCFDEDGKLLESSRVLRDILYKGIWDDLSEEEKNKLLDYIAPNTESIIDIINAYMILKKENQTLNDDKIKVLDATREIVDKYSRFQDRAVKYRHVYDLFFKELGMEDFIKKIR